jgi:hypothetical protein
MATLAMLIYAGRAALPGAGAPHGFHEGKLGVTPAPGLPRVAGPLTLTRSRPAR